MDTTTMLDMCKLANMQKGKRITILGAGIAGLVAAYKLEGIFTDTRYSEKTRLFAAWLKTIVNTISPGKLRESLDSSLKSHLMDDFTSQ